MSENALPFEGFSAACKSAKCYYPRPYGIYHKGEVYWDPKLPRRKGSVVRYFEDQSGGFTSLIVLTLDGEFLCTAFPPSWHENDHPIQREAEKHWKSLTQAQRDEILRDAE